MEDKIFTTRCRVCHSIERHYLRGHDDQKQLICRSCGSNNLKALDTITINNEESKVDEVKKEISVQEPNVNDAKEVQAVDDERFYSPFMVCKKCGSEYGSMMIDHDSFTFDCRVCGSNIHEGIFEGVPMAFDDLTDDLKYGRIVSHVYEANRLFRSMLYKVEQNKK